MEDWERESLIARIVDHVLGIAVTAAVIVFVLKVLAAQPGGRHYDAWAQACETARASGAGKDDAK